MPLFQGGTIYIYLPNSSSCPGWCGSADWGAVQQTKKLQPDLESGPHTQVEGSIPNQGAYEKTTSHYLFVCFFSLPSSLFKCKFKKLCPQLRINRNLFSSSCEFFISPSLVLNDISHFALPSLEFSSLNVFPMPMY